jgi:hypothetical protein
MPETSSYRKLFLVARILGIVVFVIAFLLPACRLGPDAPGSNVFAGWKCASVALTETTSLFGKAVTWPLPEPVILVVLSGWINPIILLVLILSVVPKVSIVRRILGIIVLVAMVGTWIFFAQEKLTPLIGHFLWIAGALLILSPEVLPCGQRSGRNP